MENIYQLSSLPDSVLIQNIQAHNEYSSDSVEVLAERHGGLINNVYNKFKSFFGSTGISMGDLKNDSKLIVWKSAESYKTDKNSKFSSWLHNQVNYQCLNAFNAHKKNKEVIFDDFNRLERPVEVFNSEDLEKIKEIIKTIDDQRILRIFELRYFDIQQKNRTNWKEIGKDLNLSSQMCIVLHNKGINLIKEKLINYQ